MGLSSWQFLRQAQAEVRCHFQYCIFNTGSHCSTSGSEHCGAIVQWQYGSTSSKRARIQWWYQARTQHLMVSGRYLACPVSVTQTRCMHVFSTWVTHIRRDPQLGATCHVLWQHFWPHHDKRIMWHCPVYASQVDLTQWYWYSGNI